MKALKKIKPLIISGVVGSIPGLFLILLTIPVQGEHELTFGVYGIYLAIGGFIIGIFLGLKKARIKLSKK